MKAKVKQTREERKTLYNTVKPGNKSMAAFMESQGSIIVYDPAFML